jgi:hypothetical protein
MTKRIAAIFLIFAVTSAAWIILGSTVQHRTYGQRDKLFEQVEGLWGTAQVQTAPLFFSGNGIREDAKKDADSELKKQAPDEGNSEGGVLHKLTIESSDVLVDFDLSHRKKGLLWYDTYTVGFQGVYTVVNPQIRRETLKMLFAFPSKNANYDNIRMTVNGKIVDITDLSKGKILVPFVLEPLETARIEIGYVSQGMDKWSYRFGDGVNRVKNFSLTMKTNFNEIDFPQNTMSPSSKEHTASGWKLRWKYADLLTGFQIGMDMPNKLNPGPLASQISYFAPVSLLFFFFVVFMVSTIKGINLHPMHYAFLAAAFFAFHLLLSYSVDHINIVAAFLISSAVSMFLVISYMRIAVGARFAAVEIGISQFIFLVLFSLAHFFEGYTGLTITIGAIITLWLMMQLTAKIDWEEKFKAAGDVDGRTP